MLFLRNEPGGCSMHIVVNGEQKEVLGSPTILNLLKEQEVASPDMVSVQLKGEFVPRESWAQVSLREGDELEFLYFMGGGSSR